jgi:hypothetical protein
MKSNVNLRNAVYHLEPVIFFVVVYIRFHYYFDTFPPMYICVLAVSTVATTYLNFGSIIIYEYFHVQWKMLF